MDNLRVAVVDDEPLAREGLVELLEMQLGVTVTGAFPDGESALAGLDEARPDALFVDINMPGMSGIELVESLDLEPAPAVVFVTAYDAHAVRAFELNAMDYLLKPVTAERLARTVERLRLRSNRSSDDVYRTRLTNLFDGLAPGRPRGVGRLIVREVGQVIVVATRELDWIEGADYYARLHAGSKTYLLRETLSSLEKRLDPGRFLRINRSAIINLARVRSIESELRGDGLAILEGGTRLKVMRNRRAELERKLESLHDSR